MLLLKPATPEDESFLYSLYASVREEEVNGFGWDEPSQKAFLTMQFQLQQRSYAMQYKEAEHRLVQLGGRSIGRLITVRLPQSILLVDISLLTAYRNQGWGSRLIRDLQKQAEDIHLPIQLHVRVGNQAKALYERLGFHTVQANEMYEAMTWHPTGDAQ